MSDAIVLPETGAAEARRTPTVYFIDDSATMREVIKIAFRREHINVVTCADAASALAQFDENPPDVVITDVIMPDQDGYSVCSQVKQNPQFAKTPVILMSGVVNKSVADRAVAVQADELVRKPFQPQELISRVKNLIGHGAPALQQPSERPVAVPSLSSLFAAPPAPRIVPPPAPVHMAPPAMESRPADNVWPRALAEAFVQQGNTGVPQAPPAAPNATPRAAGTASDLQKLRVEISRLEILVKKLQTELQIERQYNQALELHVRTLTQVD
ncbi:MAG TPA: response regulator [Candidatus Acidoferrum sp.]|nr:response regulator [Candidatus Acidoferrum sp.]